jgi:hypothetical protein
MLALFRRSKASPPPGEHPAELGDQERPHS